MKSSRLMLFTEKVAAYCDKMHSFLVLTLDGTLSYKRDLNGWQREIIRVYNFCRMCRCDEWGILTFLQIYVNHYIISEDFFFFFWFVICPQSCSEIASWTYEDLHLHFAIWLYGLHKDNFAFLPSRKYIYLGQQFPRHTYWILSQSSLVHSS